MKLAFVCHFLTTILILVFAAIYLFRSEFMPYHAVAIAKDWAEVEPSFQTLILALMRAAGGAWLGVGVGMMLILMIPFRVGLHWAKWTLPLLGIIVSVSALYATLLVRWNTPANPPWIAAALGIILSLVGCWASVVESR